MADKSITQDYNFQLIDPNGVMPNQAKDATHVQVSSFKSFRGDIVTRVDFVEVENMGTYSISRVKPFDGFSIAGDKVPRVTHKVLKEKHAEHLPTVHKLLEERFRLKLTDMVGETIK